MRADKHLITLILLMGIGPLGFSQNKSFLLPPEADSIRKPHPWIALGVSQSVNIIGWTNNRYFNNEFYSRVSWQTFKFNLLHGFFYDNDGFQTNLYDHANAGSIYYTSARTLGMNFYQSSLYAFMGSLVWEVVCESEPPSHNDLIITPIGGITIGETLYRTSDAIFDNSSRGAERVFREIAGTVLSPTRGIIRLASGEMFRKRPRTISSDAPLFRMTLASEAGYRSIYEQRPGSSRLGFPTLGLRIRYGNPFIREKHSPYQYFEFFNMLDFKGASPDMSEMEIIATLWAKTHEFDRNNQLHWGGFQHYTYYSVSTPELNERSQPAYSNTGAPITHYKPIRFSESAAFGIGAIYGLFDNQERELLRTSLHLSGILMGGHQTEYYTLNTRDYSLGRGWSSKLALEWNPRTQLQIAGRISYNEMYTTNGYDPNEDLGRLTYRETELWNVAGDLSQTKLLLLRASVDWNFYKRAGIRAEYDSYFRNTRYKYHPNISTHFREIRSSLYFRF